MKTGKFNSIDKLLSELNLIPGTILNIGGDSNFFDCCHISIKPNKSNIKEGWIDSIHVFLAENRSTAVTFSITLKFDVEGAERSTITVDKSWIDKNVSEINIWSWK